MIVIKRSMISRRKLLVFMDNSAAERHKQSERRYWHEWWNEEGRKSPEMGGEL
jgi:hypothetical protein